jgi:hypothetical protein
MRIRVKHLNALGLTAVVFMAALSASPASATTLEVGGAAHNKSVTLEATAKAGTSIIIKDTNNATVDTCTGSTFKLSTSVFTGATVTGPISSLLYFGCSHTSVVIKPGTLHLAWTSGTNEGQLVRDRMDNAKHNLRCLVHPENRRRYADRHPHRLERRSRHD